MHYHYFRLEMCQTNKEMGGHIANLTGNWPIADRYFHPWASVSSANQVKEGYSLKMPLLVIVILECQSLYQPLSCHLLQVGLTYLTFL